MNKDKLKKILIVDDDPGDIKWLKRILETNYLVIEAHDGLRAMEMVKSEHPDLVLTDVMMPKKNGYALCAHIKDNANAQDIRVVIVTGQNTETDRETGKDMGADAYLVKPVHPYQLYEIISRLLESEQ